MQMQGNYNLLYTGIKQSSAKGQYIVNININYYKYYHSFAKLSTDL